MKNSKFLGRSLFCVLLAAMLAAPLLLFAGCTIEIKSPPISAPEETEQPEAPEATSAPLPTPVPTPTPPPIAFAVPDDDAVRAYMGIGLCQPIENAMSAFGEPKDIFGQNGYVYKAIAGGADTENALVYRFMDDSTGVEFIVSQADGRILKKQISSPKAFPRLLDNASGLAVADGSQYAALRALAGTDPYLWMSFLAPNARADENRYEVCLWPDKNGQFVAVVQNGIVLKSEYQPEDTVLLAAAVDGVTPRVPRYLKPDPDNSNSALAKYSAFKKFADFELGDRKADIADKLGAPASERTEGELNVLTYEYSDPDFAGGKTTFEYYLTNDAQTALVMKSVQALPSGGEEIRGRYAPQMLPGMTMDDVKDFMGKPLETNRSYTQYGEEISYSYVGYYGSASAVFQSLGGDELCIRNEAIVTDTLEGETLYEEYVLPVEKHTPEKTPEPTPAAETPKVTLPTFSFYTLPPLKTLPPFRTLPPFITLPPILPEPTPVPTLKPPVIN